VGSKKRSATVSEVEDLSARLRRIRFSGAVLKGLKWTPGDKVKLRVNGKSRSYTPAAHDTRDGWMDVVVFLHGNGPASRWAAEATVGQQVGLSKPDSSIKAPKKEPKWALFLGDETTLGLAKALLSTLPASTRVLGAIELDAGDQCALNKLALPLTPTIRQDYYGDALLDWLGRTQLPEGKGVVWIAGESVTVRTLKLMLASRDLEKTTIKTKGYWKAKRRTVRPALSPARLAAK
jgi:NADPH-dependent ferric siderophore reductase